MRRLRNERSQVALLVNRTSVCIPHSGGDRQGTQQYPHGRAIVFESEVCFPLFLRHLESPFRESGIFSCADRCLPGRIHVDASLEML